MAHFEIRKLRFSYAANRMSRHVFSVTVTAADIVALCKQNKGGEV